MIGLPARMRVYLACGITDMRKGFMVWPPKCRGTGLDPHNGAVFVFRGKRGDHQALMSDGQGLCLYAKRLERGCFVWPKANEGTVKLTTAQLSMLLEGIDYRMTLWTAPPELVV